MMKKWDTPCGLRLAGLVVWLGIILLLVTTLQIDPAAAQQAESATGELRGTVTLDGAAVPDVSVTLHRVSSESSGEVDHAVTDATGSFHFILEPLEGSSFTVFFVTADYLSVRYFGQPIHPGDPAADYTVEVFDTTYTPREPVRIVRRDMVLIPETTGSWEVNEVVRILNPGSAALVAERDMPTWELTIPENAGSFEAGEGDILPHEISLMGNRVLLLTPVIPGERDLFIRYRLPASPGRAIISLEQPTDSVNLFVRQPSHLSAVVGLESTRMLQAENEQFLLYSGNSFAPESEIVLEWGASNLAIDPIHAALAVTLILLAIGIWAAIRNRPVRV